VNPHWLATFTNRDTFPAAILVKGTGSPFLFFTTKSYALFWVPAFDMDNAQTAASRRGRAAREIEGNAKMVAAFAFKCC
jgi:hypothetical protein